MNAPLSILVLEPNPVDLEVTLACLRSCGHDVRSARSTSQALVAMEEARPDVIVVGLSDQLAGLAAIQDLRGVPPATTVPLVGILGHQREPERAQALAAGCATVIARPVKRRTLGLAVEEALLRP